MFGCVSTRTVGVRGTANQVALANWLNEELEKPASLQGPAVAGPKFLMPGNDEDIVRVFYLARAGTPREFQQAASQIRTATNIRQGYAYYAQRALVLRGTPGQMEIAEKWISEQR